MGVLWVGMGIISLVVCDPFIYLLCFCSCGLGLVGCVIADLLVIGTYRLVTRDGM